MADWIDSSISLFRDKSIHFSYRLSLFILIVIAVLVVNDYTGLYRNYTINRRIDQIKELQSIDTAILKDTAVLSEFNRLKFKVTHDRSYLRTIWSRLNLDKTNTHTSIVVTSPKINVINSSGDFWYKVTVMLFAYFFIGILVVFGIPYNFLFSKDSAKEKLTTFVGVLFIIAMLYFYGIAYKALISLIPIFQDNLWINYVINIFGQVVLTILIVLGFKSVSKKQKAT